LNLSPDVVKFFCMTETITRSRLLELELLSRNHGSTLADIGETPVQYIPRAVRAAPEQHAFCTSIAER
jgi:hypothetical protein